MQRISLAPELSATLSRVSCWITCLLRLLHDLEHAPANLLRDGLRFGDADEVAHAAFVLRVVNLELRALLHGLAVEAVGLRRAHLDDDRLVHLVGDDGTQADLALPARGFGGLDGLLIDRHQDFSSVLDLRTRLGLGATSTGAPARVSSATAASGSKPSSFTATATEAVSCTGTGARPSSRSLITVMMRAMSWRTLAIWLEFSSWPTACLNRSSESSPRALFMRSANWSSSSSLSSSTFTGHLQWPPIRR